MTETEFIEASDALMDAVEDAVAELDIDTERAGNVLTLETDDGEQIVINRHTPTQQMWLASRRGGLHFSLEGERWGNTRGGEDFWGSLQATLSALLEEDVRLHQ